MKYSLLYRGFLTSCNYGCRYCPFAKRTETPQQLERDQHSLRRFTEWIAEQTDHQWRILFTPWGEALVRAWYRDAIVRLSRLPHVERVSAQTNLSCSISWVVGCEPQRFSLWATFHPTETTAAAFTHKVRQLRARGFRLSVGMVAAADHMLQIEAMRQRLPADVYMWLNAQQPRPRPYTPDEVARFTAIDPHFSLTLFRKPSRGKQCRTGETIFSVDGRGDMRRCHFVDEVIGNIFSPDWQSALRPRSCPKHFCNCFLGISQLRADELSRVFGHQLLDRIAMA